MAQQIIFNLTNIEQNDQMPYFMKQRMQRLQHNGFDIHFSELCDPRISRSKLYPLIEILFVVLCGSICGAESWRDFVLFGKEKIDLLRDYYPFENGIASRIFLLVTLF